MSSELIFNELIKVKKDNCYLIPDLNHLEKHLNKLLKPNDLLITLGAGTIWRYNISITNYLKNKSKVK